MSSLIIPGYIPATWLLRGEGERMCWKVLRSQNPTLPTAPSLSWEDLLSLCASGLVTAA